MLLLLFTERDGVTELVLSSDVRCLTGHNITTLFLNSVKVTAPSARFYIFHLVSCWFTVCLFVSSYFIMTGIIVRSLKDSACNSFKL